jgi:hypothetical protein
MDLQLTKLIGRAPCAIGCIAILAVILSSPAWGQQDYVTRFDVYAGYAGLQSPLIDLSAKGFQVQAGYRKNMWLTMGFDYSRTTGDLKLTPDLLPDALAANLAAQLKALAAAGRLPAGYTLVVPATAVTQTFAAGPQFSYRGFKTVTLFVRPSFGAIREVATPHPGDAIATAIVAQLAPTNKKEDWQGFYGIGYGFDINFGPHFSLRFQGDTAWDHLFNDLIKTGRWSQRFSIGPAFNFGKNIAK